MAGAGGAATPRQYITDPVTAYPQNGNAQQHNAKADKQEAAHVPSILPPAYGCANIACARCVLAFVFPTKTPILMQPTNTTELEAINTMPSTIGEAPVDSLTATTSSDATADQVLTEVVRETLVQGGTSTSTRTTGSTATASATSSCRPTQPRHQNPSMSMRG